MARQCENDSLIKWLDEHLNDLPCDWEIQDEYYGRGTSVIFYTKEENN